MSDAKQQQVKERSSPSEYILLTIQQPCKDACVKRTGLLVGFGGKEDQMVGLEIDGTLNFHDSLVYSITKVEWNFGRKQKIKFFEPDENNTQVNDHVKNQALKLVKKLFENITVKMGLEPKGYFNADRLYKNPPKHTAEEITEPVMDKVEKKPSTTTPPATYPDGGIKKPIGAYNGGASVPVGVHVPPTVPKTQTQTKTYKKEGPAMFRRSSTERVKARVAAVLVRLEELDLLAATEEVEKKVEQLKDTVKRVRKEERELPKELSPFCEDCKKRSNCIGEVARVFYCTNKIPEND